MFCNFRSHFGLSVPKIIGASVLLCTWTGTPHVAAQTVVVVTTPAHAISFDPDKALGSSVDILPTRRIDTIDGPQVLKESLSAGWGSHHLPAKY